MGEWIFSYAFNLIKGLVSGQNPFASGWDAVVNEAKIMGGLFTSDKTKNVLGQTWEIVSRFTWQAPQTFLGFEFSYWSNNLGQVDNVDYYGGATVVSGNFFGSEGAVTLGSYINGDRSIKAEPNNSLFQHEYGHYLQSQSMGWGYLSRIGIPSLMSTFIEDENHDFQIFEQDANRRAFMYFNKREGDKFYQTKEEYEYNQRYGIEKGWNFYQNPMDVNHIGEGSRYYYYDYHNPAHRALVNGLSLRAKWYDYFDPFGLIIGTGNGLYYRNHRIR